MKEDLLCVLMIPGDLEVNKFIAKEEFRAAIFLIFI
jgi:hypothetical protein